MTLVGMIGVMFYLNWRFTLIALSVSPVVFLVVHSYTRRIKSASRAVRKQEGILLSVVSEVLTSIRVVKAFAREDYEQKRFESESLANVEAGLEARGIKAKLSPLVEIIVALGTCLVLWYGARLALTGKSRRGAHRLLLYLGRCISRAGPLEDGRHRSKAMAHRGSGSAGLESRVRDSPARDRPQAGRADSTRSFSYADGKQVLKDVSLTIEAGQVAGVVGPSGTGRPRS
jgi:subfamily B ATP-binding cassette protein MsbA